MYLTLLEKKTTATFKIYLLSQSGCMIWLIHDKSGTSDGPVQENSSGNIQMMESTRSNLHMRFW